AAKGATGLTVRILNKEVTTNLALQASYFSSIYAFLLQLCYSNFLSNACLSGRQGASFIHSLSGLYLAYKCAAVLFIKGAAVIKPFAIARKCRVHMKKPVPGKIIRIKIGHFNALGCLPFRIQGYNNRAFIIHGFGGKIIPVW